MPADETRFTASQAFRFQSAICRGQEAELWAGLLERCAEDIDAGGPVGRSATMLDGFHAIYRRFDLPLSLRELGASAGLNLLWDRYRYELGEARWGDEHSAVRLRSDWSGPPPLLVEHVEIESRRGCDLSPIHIAEPEARAHLEAYVWADQPDRLMRLRGAISIALDDAPILEANTAANWLAEAQNHGRWIRWTAGQNP